MGGQALSSILFCSFEFPPFVEGGAGVYAANLVPELKRTGLNVQVVSRVALERKAQAVSPGMRSGRLLHLPFASAPTYWAESLLALRRHLSEGRPALVHSNGPSAVALIPWLRRIGIPYVATIHHLARDRLAVERPSPLVRLVNLRTEVGITPLLERYVINQASHLIAVSNHVARRIQAVYGVPDQDITTIYHGLRSPGGNRRDMPETEGRALGQLLGRPAGPLVLCVGRLERSKGVQLLLEAFRQTLRIHQATLVLVGSGNVQHYQRMVERLGIDGNVWFLGHVSDELRDRLYSMARVVVVPSSIEGYSLVALEALAHNRWVVTTATGGIQELPEAETRVLNARPEPGDLASVMTEALGRADEFSQADPSKFRSWRRTAEEHIEVYRRVMEQEMGKRTFTRNARGKG